MFEGRNEVYAGFYQQKKPLTWGEHKNWWRSRNADWRTFIIQDECVDVGVVTLGQLDHWSPEIGYYVLPNYWGNGIGKKAVKQAVEWLKRFGYEYCHTTVKDDNKRSIRLLKSLGFTELGDARLGEKWYQKKL
jgi:RimJ/RimL family protein N-acetyltransferase